MVTRTTKSTGPEEASGGPTPDLASTVKESAQQIWLAGLGAFAKAQEEGSKVFDTLVKDGLSMQRKTQAAAGEKLSEATSRMATMANDISSKATGQWDKLETIFEDRVFKALNKLGVPTAKDIEVLSARIEELNRNISRLGPRVAAAKRAPGKTARPATATRKTPRKPV